MANLSRLGRGLAVELAGVASAATPDVGADSAQLSQLRNELFWIHLLVRCLPRSPLCLLDSSLELTEHAGR